MLRIRISLIQPACHFDAFPDPDPTFHLDLDPACHLIWIRIRIQLITVIRIRIRILPFNLMRSRIRNTGNDVRFRTSTSVINLHANNPLKSDPGLFLVPFKIELAHNI